MSRFREYRNGVYGVRYLGHYIRTQKGRHKTDFTILKEDGADGPVFATLNDAEWYLDLQAAEPSEIRLVHRLYEQDDFALSSMLVDYSQRRESLTPEEETVMNWVKKVRDRRLRSLPEEPVAVTRKADGSEPGEDA